MIVRNASQRGAMSFRCPIFSLSGPCELLFILCIIVVSVMLYLCILCVALLMDLIVLCVPCLKQFAICLGVIVILLFSVGGGALLDRPCIVFQKMCVCACDPRVHLGVPSIGFVYVFVCGEVISPFKRDAQQLQAFTRPHSR